MKFIENITEIANQYDFFIFDVWGVIHDGNEAYPDVVKAISYLKNKNKRICFLSNAPRRAKKIALVLEKFGISPNLYDFIISSGEATFLDLQKNQENGFKNYGKNYFYIGPKKDIDLLDGLNYQIVDDASKANFAITTGFDNDDSKLEEKMPQLLAAKENNLELICVNPDMIVVRQNGDSMLCAGELAKKYLEIGGKVTFYGKPFASVYKIVCEIFNNNQNSKISKNKIIMIGDGIETDIRGANEFGIDSLLVTGGILSKTLGIKYSEKANEAKLTKICQVHQEFPKFVISNLKI